MGLFARILHIRPKNGWILLQILQPYVRPSRRWQDSFKPATFATIQPIYHAHQLTDPYTLYYLQKYISIRFLILSLWVQNNVLTTWLFAKSIVGEPMMYRKESISSWPDPVQLVNWCICKFDRFLQRHDAHPDESWYGYRTDNKKPPVIYRFLNLSVILDLSPGVFLLSISSRC